MPASRRFGTFGGVFTPAILTILGVIMYMRLPWIVGNAGLTLTIGVVVVAHIVSITTGLSVSSMATDKRVRAGGSYYILSRSLGLPIGGTLGVALFIGLSFSVSLYIIGFSESFLGYFGWEVTPANIRIAGSIVLLGVTTVTFISTALAIKTQYFIMAAIVISLVSIIIGNDAPPPDVTHMSPIEGGASLAVIFAIFFPAVTGFEAGVSMSGDLKDPRRSIPGGTLVAIGVGLFVYIALTIFFSWRIPAEQLAKNPRVLLDYAWNEDIVVPGIWGATISSALGSILGAPRILQALSADRVGPAFFSVGTGPDNEPRNALLLTFFIALSGILIGELDVIARVVSMFFMTSYGFLNLACAIEGRVSPDFRPEFRIPTLVSLIGAVICIVLMVQLDFVAMIGASLAMGALYLLLRRKQLKLEGGDSWAGVWNWLVRSALARLQRTSEHQRNWSPSLVAFAGGTGRELAEQLAGAAVTVFEDDDADFRRRLPEQGDPWDARAAVCRFHGLPGLEPNTVLVDSRQVVADTAGFARFMEQVRQGDYSVLVLHDRGTPQAARSIDAWSRLGGPNLALQLALVRQLIGDPPWSQARVRFLVMIDEAGQRRIVEHRLVRWLKDARVRAEVEIFVPSGNPFDEIGTRSAGTDLTLLGLPGTGDPSQFQARLRHMTERINTALLIRAGEGFEDPLATFSLPQTSTPDSAPSDETHAPATPAESMANALVLPQDPALAAIPIQLQVELVDAMETFSQGSSGALLSPVVSSKDALVRRIESSLQQLARTANLEPRARRSLVWARIMDGLLASATERIELLESHLTGVAPILESALSALDDGLATAVLGLDEAVQVTLPKGSEGEPRAGSAEGGALTRLRRNRRVRLRAIAIRKLAASASDEISLALDRARASQLQALVGLDALLSWAVDAVAKLMEHDEPDVIGVLDELHERRDQWREQNDLAIEAEGRALAAYAASVAQDTADQLAHPRSSVTRTGTPGQWLDARDLAEHHAARLDPLAHLLTRLRLDLLLRRARHQLGTRLEEAATAFRSPTKALLADLSDHARALDDPEASTGSTITPRASASLFGDAVQSSLAEVVDSVAHTLPTELKILNEGVLEALEKGLTDDISVKEIALARLVAHLLETELLGEVHTPIIQLVRAARRAEDARTEVGRLLQADRQTGGRAEMSWLAEQDELVEASRARVEEASEQLSNASEVVERALSDARTRIAKQLDGHALVASADELVGFVRAESRGRWLGGAWQVGASIRQHVQASVVDLSYRWSQGVLAARALERSVERTATVEQLLHLRERLAPSERALSSLPHYYRRAFLSQGPWELKHWHDPKAELTEAARALSAQTAGRPGAILISGAPGAGTSALVERIEDAHLQGRKRFLLHPPEIATDAPDDLDDALRAAVLASAAVPVDQIFKNLPRGAVVVVPDLDRWWLRHKEGLGAIHRLCEWIDHHGERICFLLSGGAPSVAFLQRVTPLSQLVLAHIEAPPLPARALRGVILGRHEATGMSLWIGMRGRTPSEWQLSRLFSGLFQHARGYLGPALAAWIAHIDEASSDGVVLRRPGVVDLDLLERLDAKWLAALAALALHRRLDQRGLALATGGLADPALMRALLRAGFAVRRGEGIELDRFMGSHLVSWLQEQEVV